MYRYQYYLHRIGNHYSQVFLRFTKRVWENSSGVRPQLNSTTKTTRHTLKKVPASVPPISMSFCLKVRAHVCVHVCAREREREIMEMKQKEYR